MRKSLKLRYNESNIDTSREKMNHSLQVLGVCYFFRRTCSLGKVFSFKWISARGYNFASYAMFFPFFSFSRSLK